MANPEDSIRAPNLSGSQRRSKRNVCRIARRPPSPPPLGSSRYGAVCTYSLVGARTLSPLFHFSSELSYGCRSAIGLGFPACGLRDSIPPMEPFGSRRIMDPVSFSESRRRILEPRHEDLAARSPAPFSGAGASCYFRALGVVIWRRGSPRHPNAALHLPPIAHCLVLVARCPVTRFYYQFI